MPGKTHGEKIDDLLHLAATLAERVDNLRSEVERFEQKTSSAAEKLNAAETRLALVDQQVKDLQEARKESGRRIWLILGPIIGAAVGSAVTYLLKSR